MFFVSNGFESIVCIELAYYNLLNFDMYGCFMHFQYRGHTRLYANSTIKTLNSQPPNL